jgi:DNA-binding transcriptional LysR family regulator
MARSRMRRYFRHGLLPQLIAFEACVRLGGVTRAADELSLAQPTVSGMLRRLSETVGAPLLLARGKRIELTQDGVRVLALCGEMLDSLARFEKDGANAPRR